MTKPMSLIKEEESKKEYEGEEEEEDITLSKTLEMADKLKMYCLRKGISEYQFNSIHFLFRQSCTIEYNIIYIYIFTIDKPSCKLD